MSLLKYSLVRNVIFGPVIILGILQGIFILLSVLLTKGPRWMFHEKKRDKRPACMEDPQLGTHRFVKVKDLNFHIVESGDPQKPLMLFLHGFPECWYSWRHQIREFNKDYHCVAFDMRGVGETDAPAGINNYTIDKLTGDVCELIKVMGHKSCVLVGHDWGGLVTWEFSARYPEMVDKYIAMNIPHPDQFAELVIFFPPQMIKSWYVYFYQMPYLPEILVRMGDYVFLKRTCPKGVNAEDDIEAFKFSMSRPGRATTFINYYRNIMGQLFAGTGLVKPPTLLIWGTGDLYLHPKLSYETEKFCTDLTVERIEGGDHFIQQDQPQKVNKLMRKYLDK